MRFYLGLPKVTFRKIYLWTNYRMCLSQDMFLYGYAQGAGSLEID